MSWFNRERGPEVGTYRLVEEATGKPDLPIQYKIEILRWLSDDSGSWKAWFPVETLTNRDQAYDRLSKYRALPVGSRVIG